MALKNSAVRYTKLTPPVSPSRRASSTVASAAMGGAAVKPRSRLLAALDAEIDLEAYRNAETKAPADKPDSGAPSAGASKGRSNWLSPKATLAPAASPASVPPPPVQDPPSSWEPYVRKVPSTLPPIPGFRAKRATREKASKSAAAELSALEPQPHETLPRYSYKEYETMHLHPRIVYARTEAQADAALARLEHGPLGFDMEWRAFFQSGFFQVRRTAVVQLADRERIVLVHVSNMRRFPQKLKAILEDPSIPKVGANIKHDGAKLFADYHIAARNLVELGAFAHQADPAFSQTYKRRIVSLAKMVAMYARRELDKGDVRVGNWEAVPLSETQQTYAANDVHAGLMVYLFLCRMAERAGRTLKPEAFTHDIAASHGLHEVPSAMHTTWAGTRTVAVSASSGSSATTATATVSVSSKGTAPAPAPPTPPAPAPAPARPTDSEQLLLAMAADPRYRRAYELWRAGTPLAEMRAALRSPARPLAAGTVLGYVVGALQADRTLPCAPARLRELVAADATSWLAHGPWVLEQERAARARAQAQDRALDALAEMAEPRAGAALRQEEEEREEEGEEEEV